MSQGLVTVEQAADLLDLHPKTLLRYIREGRLPATRIGKSWRIVRAELDAFAGIFAPPPQPVFGAQATCIVDIPGIAVDQAERIATFLQAAALSGDGGGPKLHLQTAYDPSARTMKLVLIGAPSEAGRLLEMLDVQLRAFR